MKYLISSVCLFVSICIFLFLFCGNSPVIRFDRNKNIDNFRQLNCVGGKAKQYSHLIQQLTCKKVSFNTYNCDLDNIILSNNRTIVITNKRVICNKYNNCRMMYDLDYLEEYKNPQSITSIIIPLCLIICCFSYEFYKIVRAKKQYATYLNKQDSYTLIRKYHH